MNSGFKNLGIIPLERLETRRLYARRLRKARSDSGMTQHQLASKSGVPRCAISWYETARCLPVLNKLVRIADALNISTDYLLGRTTQKGRLL